MTTASRYWDGIHYKTVTVEADPDTRYAYTTGLPWFHIWRRRTLPMSGATYFSPPACHGVQNATGRMRMLPIPGTPICFGCLLSLGEATA